jgi:7-carboxy-7-deazaguanine synthase
MKVNEIFFSIQGEGLQTGYPTVFVRFTGCNLRCGYCDTSYAYYEGVEMSVEQVVSRVKGYGCKRVCLTGGEPLLQPDFQGLLTALKGYTVSIETNGSIPLNRFCLLAGQTYVLDIKSPSSGQLGEMYLPNLAFLRDEDEIKFVLGDREDYLWCRGFLSQYYKRGNITLSPVFGKIDPELMVEWILEDRLEVRFQLQLHKLIYDPERRGV